MTVFEGSETARSYIIQMKNNTNERIYIRAGYGRNGKKKFAAHTRHIMLLVLRDGRVFCQIQGQRPRPSSFRVALFFVRGHEMVLLREVQRVPPVGFSADGVWAPPQAWRKNLRTAKDPLEIFSLSLFSFKSIISYILFYYKQHIGKLRREILHKCNINALIPGFREIPPLHYRFEQKRKKEKRKRTKEFNIYYYSLAFSRCISRSASRIPSRDRPREYRLSWPLDTIPDPFAITRMHCTQRQCFETIRDCRHSGVTRTCTYTCTHADIPAPRYSIIATSLLHFTSRSRLRATMYILRPERAAFARETERENA